jgi:hypothetical protein
MAYRSLMTDTREAVIDEIMPLAPVSETAVIDLISELIKHCVTQVDEELKDYCHRIDHMLFGHGDVAAAAAAAAGASGADQKTAFSTPSSLPAKPFPTSGLSTAAGGGGLSIVAHLRRHHDKHLDCDRLRRQAHKAFQRLVVSSSSSSPCATSSMTCTAAQDAATDGSQPMVTLFAVPRVRAALATFAMQMLRIAWAAKLNDPPLCFKWTDTPSVSSAAYRRAAVTRIIEDEEGHADPAAVPPSLALKPDPSDEDSKYCVAYPALRSFDGVILVRGEVLRREDTERLHTHSLY